MRIVILFVASLITFKMYSCPITITNDTDQKIIITDPRGNEAIFLDLNGTGVIDPTITHVVIKYFQDEKLDFYYPIQIYSNSFYKKYRLTEKYCVDDPRESEFTVSQIINFVKNPSDRFKVVEFHPVKKLHSHEYLSSRTKKIS